MGQTQENTDKCRILIVDDELELRKSIITILQNSIPDYCIEIEEAENGLEAIQKIFQNDFDLVLMDVKMPELDGLSALTKIKENDPQTFVVLMTAHANLQDAIQAIKEGAYDYLEKPVDPLKLIEIVKKSNDARNMVSDLALSNPIFDDDIDSEFVGKSQKMKEVFGLIYKLCKVDTTVLIRGENGTGKELVARAIHYNSPRKSGSFVAINCGAIPESLMESELFGHEKGAFTGATERKIGKFQLANNGTLFLDEIGELKPDMQVKLLRVLQEKVFTPIGGNREIKTNARIIAATNRNLEKMIEENKFREDLFYRLNVLPIFLPPLRERTDDIQFLAQHFIKKVSKQHVDSPINSISATAIEAMKNYNWPGNIRELENIIERAFFYETTNEISVTSLPDSIKRKPSNENLKFNSVTMNGGNYSINAPQSALNFDNFREQSEKEFIISALKVNKGKINQTVAQANIPKNTLLRKIKKYGINTDDFKD